MPFARMKFWPAPSSLKRHHIIRVVSTTLGALVGLFCGAGADLPLVGAILGFVAGRWLGFPGSIRAFLIGWGICLAFGALLGFAAFELAYFFNLGPGSARRALATYTGIGWIAAAWHASALGWRYAHPEADRNSRASSPRRRATVTSAAIGFLIGIAAAISFSQTIGPDFVGPSAMHVLPDVINASIVVGVVFGSFGGIQGAHAGRDLPSCPIPLVLWFWSCLLLGGTTALVLVHLLAFFLDAHPLGFSLLFAPVVGMIVPGLILYDRIRDRLLRAVRSSSTSS